MKKSKTLSSIIAYVFICIIYPQWVLAQPSTEVEMPTSVPIIEESYMNTITSTDTDGTSYKLVVIGDVLPKLYLNGKSIKADELKNYSHIIDKLSLILWNRQKKSR